MQIFNNKMGLRIRVCFKRVAPEIIAFFVDYKFHSFFLSLSLP
jgi:hypothetical protein